MVRMDMDVKQITQIVERGVRYRARKHFLNNDFKNPYGSKEGLYPEGDLIKSGMWDWFDCEMSELLNSKLCPCCGQMTLGDIDF